MRRFLQSIIHNRKVYDRPQDEWTCGRAAEGCPCIFGPGKKGECRATFQCMPAKKGDRWVCTRLISLGGACPAGPNSDGTCCNAVPPCRPKRSLRGLRRQATWLVVCLALGITILTLGGRDREKWTSPGPLTSQHATSAQRCANCHVETGLPPLTPEGVAKHLHVQNQLCLECHDLGKQATMPHGIAAGQLAALTGKAKAAPVTSTMILAVARQLAPAPHAEIACATCHTEHGGRAANLKVLANQQCQSCHTAQFEGISSGHPEFTSYPYERRTRLHFDHASHWGKHFAEPRVAAVAPTSCTVCHEPAANGRMMHVKNFEQTCAPCHAGQIAGEGRAGDKGVSFFRLPAFDLATLGAAGVEVGDYPAYAEGELTPFMRWMLEADPKAKAALDALKDVDLASLAGATPAQKAAAGQLLWSVKGLFADLVTQGQQVLLRRMDAPAKPDPAMANRTGQLPADNLQAAQQAWIPDLLTEVAAWRRGEKIPAHVAAPTQTTTPAPVAATVKPAASDDLLADDTPAAAPAQKAVAVPATMTFADAEQRVARGGWYRRDETYTVFYRPVGHADPFLTAWLDATVRDQTPAAGAIFAQLSEGPAPGLCLKCHTVDDQPAGAVVNWRTRKMQPEHHAFTKFKHEAHFSLVGDQGCMTCHVLAPKDLYAGSFGPNRNPAVFHSNFVPMTKESCVTCHKPGVAGTDCLHCHNYHTGDWQAPKMRSSAVHILSTQLDKPAEPAPEPAAQ